MIEWDVGAVDFSTIPLPPSLTRRANPSPKVTDLLCRLPLSTFFYQLEAVHLGDLLRLSVRRRAMTTAPLAFHGPSRALRTGLAALLFRPARPLPRQSVSGAALRPLERKDNSSRGSRRRCQARLRCRCVFGPALRSGILAGFPFGEAQTAPITRPPHHLRIGSPTVKCCSRGTLPHFSLQGSRLNICYYHQDLHWGQFDWGLLPNFHTTPTPSYLSYPCMTAKPRPHA